MADCVFCEIVAGRNPATIEYEDDEILAFQDIYPEGARPPPDHPQAPHRVRDGPRARTTRRSSAGWSWPRSGSARRGASASAATGSRSTADPRAARSCTTSTSTSWPAAARSGRSSGDDVTGRRRPVRTRPTASAGRGRAEPTGRRPSHQSTPERVRLANGLTAVLQPHDAAEVAAVQLWVRAGARDERPDEAGLSHFIEHLLFKGTPSRGPGVIDQTISGLGGEMNAATSQDWTYFHVVLPAARLDTALDILADAAQHAAFDPVEVERERHVVLEEIRRAADTPERRPLAGAVPRALRRARVRAAGARHRRVHRGSAARDDRRLLPPLLRAEQRDGGGGRAACRRTGASTPWREAFGALGAAPAPGAAAGGLPRPPGAPRRAAGVEGAPPDVPRLAWAGAIPPDPDVYALDLVTTVLGQGRSSRLVQSLRERLGLVSGIGEQLLPPARRGDDRGHRPDDDGALRGDRGGGPGGGRAPLGGAGHRGGVRAGADGGGGRPRVQRRDGGRRSAYTLGTADTVWTLEFELGYVDAVRRVTREAMREAARRHLRPDRFTGAVIGAAAAGGGE